MQIKAKCKSVFQPFVSNTISCSIHEEKENDKAAESKHSASIMIDYILLQESRKSIKNICFHIK